MTDRKVRRFVSLLMRKGAFASQTGDGFRVVTSDGQTCQIDHKDLKGLLAQGVIAATPKGLSARSEARSWLRRNALNSDRAGSSRIQDGIAGTERRDSPVTRLASAGSSETPFLSPQQLRAAEKVHRLTVLGLLGQRVTMSYDAAGKVDSGAGAARSNFSDQTLDAQKQLHAVLAQMPKDVAVAVLEIAGLEKSVQSVEKERDWPKRSGKMLLRAGLDLAARQMGMEIGAGLAQRSKPRAWLDSLARPTLLE